jgi:hypothetical protein
MRGTAGLTGWQWLFIIEGLFTLVVGVTFVLLFPSSPESPVNLLKKRYFTERETHILVQRVLLDDPTKRHKSKNVTGKELKATVCTDRILSFPKLINFDVVHQLEAYSPYLGHDLRSCSFGSAVELCTDSDQRLWIWKIEVQCNGQHWTVGGAAYVHSLGLCRVGA